MAGSAALALLLVAAGGWFLAGRMLAPLARITDATRMAASGSLAAMLGGCATMPSQPVQAPVFPPPAQPNYAWRSPPNNSSAMQMYSPRAGYDRSWGHDLAAAGAGAGVAVAGT